MPAYRKSHIRIIESINCRIGRVAMDMIFVLVGVVLWPPISKTFLLPSPWTLELPRFTMVAYYMLGMSIFAVTPGGNPRSYPLRYC